MWDKFPPPHEKGGWHVIEMVRGTKECPRRFKEKVHLHLKFCISSLDL